MQAISKLDISLTKTVDEVKIFGKWKGSYLDIKLQRNDDVFSLKLESFDGNSVVVYPLKKNDAKLLISFLERNVKFIKE